MIHGLLTVLAGALCLFRFHFTWRAAVTFLWLCVLIRIAVHDYHTLEIPDRYNLILFGIGLVSMLPAFFSWTPLAPYFTLSSSMPSLKDRIFGIFIISLPMLFMDLLIPGGFGGGDIKLMASAGVFLGWKSNLQAAILAFVAAGLYSIFLLLMGKVGRKDAFAFGPFLCGGLAFVILYGDVPVITALFGDMPNIFDMFGI